MEKFSKKQIIYLAFLVGVVAAITTGIVVIFLLSVMSRSNTFVDYTKIQAVQRLEIVNEVIRAEGFVVADAVEKVTPFVVPLFVVDEHSVLGTDIGVGYIVDGSGAIITNSSYFSDYKDGETDEIRMYSGERGFDLSVVKVNEGFTILAVKNDEDSISGMVRARIPDLRLGQSVVAIFGVNGHMHIERGIISQFVFEEAVHTEQADEVPLIYTDIVSADKGEKGILITLEGGIAGILRGDGAVVPLEDIFK